MLIHRDTTTLSENPFGISRHSLQFTKQKKHNDCIARSLHENLDDSFDGPIRGSLPEERFDGRKVRLVNVKAVNPRWTIP